MSSEDTNKLIGRLEKGVEMLETGLRDSNRNQANHSEKMLSALQELRLEFRDEMRGLRSQLDGKTSELHEQIDSMVNNHTNLRLSVQKLAGTISLIVGVGIYIVKGVFDVAKDVIASTFFGS